MRKCNWPLVGVILWLFLIMAAIVIVVAFPFEEALSCAIAIVLSVWTLIVVTRNWIPRVLHELFDDA